MYYIYLNVLDYICVFFRIYMCGYILEYIYKYGYILKLKKKRKWTWNLCSWKSQKVFFFPEVYGCLPTCMCVCLGRGQERALFSLELMLLSHILGSEDQSWVLCKSRQCS